MKILYLSIIAILLFALVPPFSVSGQEVNMSPPQKLEYTAKMDKLNYENTERPLILISGSPNSTLPLLVLDPLNHQKLIDTIRIGQNGTARYVLDITSYSFGVYHALVGSGYDRINLGFTVGLKTTGTVMRLNVPTFVYKPGEIIEARGSFDADSIIQVDLINPHGVSENSTKVTSDHFGNYLARLEVPHDAVNGVWKLSATGGMAKRILDITVISNYTQQAKITNPNTVSPPIHTLILGHPLKQFKSGTAAKDINCKDGFQLIIKAETSSPACVKPNSAGLLILREWALESPNHMLVYHMKSNSTAQIIVKYNSGYFYGPTQLIPRIYDGKTQYQTPPSKISAIVGPNSVPGNANATVTYTITTNNTKGVYWLAVDACQFIPIAVDVDSSQITSSDLQFIMSGWRCPVSLLHYHVVSVSNATVEYRED